MECLIKCLHRPKYIASVCSLLFVSGMKRVCILHSALFILHYANVTVHKLSLTTACFLKIKFPASKHFHISPDKICSNSLQYTQLRDTGRQLWTLISTIVLKIRTTLARPRCFVTPASYKDAQNINVRDLETRSFSSKRRERAPSSDIGISPIITQSLPTDSSSTIASAPLPLLSNTE